MKDEGEIILRAPEPEDIDFLLHIENERKWWYLSGTLLPFSRFDMEQYVFSADKDIFSNKQVRFIIELQHNKMSSTIGTIDLFDFEPIHRRAGVGIMILEEFRGKTYGTTALWQLTEYAFIQLQLHQLYCNIEADNQRSISLFTKQGFEIAGLKKDWNLKNGKWVDEYVLQLINRDNL